MYDEYIFPLETTEMTFKKKNPSLECMLLWIMIACDFKHGPGPVPPVPLLFTVSVCSGSNQEPDPISRPFQSTLASCLSLSLSGYQKGTEVTVLNPS